jgi:aminoglycoside 6'-N-acetyltransferase
MAITLRTANIKDHILINYWSTKPHVIFATGISSSEGDDWLEKQLIDPEESVEIYLALLDGEPIGLIQIVDPANESSHYWGSIEQGCRAIDIWIGEESNLGKGYGTTMMKLAIDHCFKDLRVNKIIIDPLVINTRAIKFYNKLGFVFVENRYFDDDYCSILELCRHLL